jgi:pyrroloquinoline quinone biosynthesis protein B
MQVRLVGSAAGGGFPQWNCACANCRGVRAGTVSATARTQTSAAVSADGERWLLLGASPDVHLQIARTPALWPRAGRGSPIAGVALPNGDLDAWLGLLSLREWAPLALFATPVVRRDLVDENALWRTLERYPGQTRFTELAPGTRVAAVAGLTIEAVAAPGKPPLHMMGRRAADPLDNVGLIVRDEARGATLAWFPSVAAPTPAIERALREADVVFFDGTFFCDDELAAAGVGTGLARDMGHWPVGGDDGSAAFVARSPAAHKWLVHVNNTNPLLVDDSAERRALEALGIGVAHDGLEWTR